MFISEKLSPCPTKQSSLSRGDPNFLIDILIGIDRSQLSVKRKHQEVRREKLLVYIRILSSNIHAWYLIVPTTKYCQIYAKKIFFYS